MAEQRRRARDLGITIGSYPTGALNAITDVAGVEVGQATVRWGDARLPAGQGPARTGVTAIWPHRDDLLHNHVAAGFFSLSGTGELIGRTDIDERGVINTPILLTNTMSMGAVFDATCRYLIERDPGVGAEGGVEVPVVAECDDSYLNDARGLHITPEHVTAALDGASGGPVEEGCAGGGTGMHCFGFKGGIGTSSRRLPDAEGGWMVGVLVMTNFGWRRRLTIAGVPVGQYFPESDDEVSSIKQDEGSCIVVVATDAPLHGHDLSRVARRAALGLGRTGSNAGNTSGELLMAFSTTYRPGNGQEPATRRLVEGDAIGPIFAAAIDATEESVLNALCMATTTDGRQGRVLEALPLDRLQEILRTHRAISV